MRILIIDQCSASKVYPDSTDPLTLEELIDDPAELIDRYALNGIRAGDLYTGKQNNRINSAVRTLRSNNHTVNRHIVSAGFGLVSEDEPLPPYDVTFAEMNSAEIRKRGQDLELTFRLQEQLDQSQFYDIAFFALGADYYEAFDLKSVLLQAPDEMMIVLFNKENLATDRESVISLPARTQQAREHGAAVIGLKGTYIENFAIQLESSDPSIDESLVSEYCMSTESVDQTEFDAYQG